MEMSSQLIKKNKYIEYVDYLNNWLNQYLKKNKIKNLVIGLSGGIDSAVAAAILLRNKSINLDLYFINIHSSNLDSQCVKAFDKKFKTKTNVLNLSNEYDLLVKKNKLKSQLAKDNLKPRLRMINLYAVAAEKNALVVGTSNAAELYMGFFTKFGDSACDISLLSKLKKSDIYQIAKELDVPKIIIKRQPSASLRKDQYDEQEMGVKYEDIDLFLSNKQLRNKNALNKIIDAHKKNNHKFLPPPSPVKKIK